MSDNPPVVQVESNSRMAAAPKNMTESNNSNRSYSSASTTAQILTLYNNELSVLEAGYWQNQNGVVPYLKIAPIFQEMKGQTPTRGQSMYDWRNSSFIPIGPLHLPALLEAFNTVKKNELERIEAGRPTGSGIPGQGIKIGNPNSSNGMYVVVGNELKSYGMYVVVRTVKNGNENDNLFDLTGNLQDTTYNRQTDYDHNKSEFGNVSESTVPFGIVSLEIFLNQALKNAYAPFGIGGGNASSSGSRGTPLQTQRVPGNGSQNESESPPVEEVSREQFNL